MNRIHRSFFLFLLFFPLEACLVLPLHANPTSEHQNGDGESEERRPPLGNPEYPYPMTEKPRIGDIVHMPTGILVSRQQMLDAVTDARIIYVGETHDNPASHHQQLTILKAMTERYPGRTSLGMEMFTPSQQPALDRWVAGELSEKDFLRLSRWYSNWSMDFALYRPLLEYARRKRIPVIALNAEKDQVKMLRNRSLEELSAEERAALPRMDFTDPYQSAMIRAYFGGHAHGEVSMDRFVRIQTLWDETMARNVAAYLSRPANRDRRMLVMAGGNHIRYGVGIPRRVFRRLPSSYILVGSQEIEVPESKKSRRMTVDLPDMPMVALDFLEFTRYEELRGEKVQLGVLLKSVDGRVRVESLLPHSTAARAGIKADDIIVSIDGTAVKEEFDLIYEIKNRKPGDKSVLVIERAGKTMRISVTFENRKDTHAEEP